MLDDSPSSAASAVCIWDIDEDDLDDQSPRKKGKVSNPRGATGHSSAFSASASAGHWPPALPVVEVTAQPSRGEIKSEPVVLCNNLSLQV